MRGTFRLGKLFGIDLFVDWSWTLIFLLMTWNLTAVFRTWHPTWNIGSSFVLAALAAILFFSSVLAHELGHSVVATSFGMKVREIRLFLFGGVSNIEKEPPSPGIELLMAIAGPLVSFAIGVASLAAAAVILGVRGVAFDAADPMSTLAGLDPLTTLLVWLGPVNIMVGAFNLIPGFPLDGGRVLRAIVWRITGDLHKATFTASIVGRGIGWLFVVMGIAMVFGVKIPFFGQGAGSGVWLAFIGWFLTSAAERTFDNLVVQEILENVSVAQIMRRTGYVVPPETTVRSAVDEWFMRSSERAFPVVSDDNKLLGLVCVADIRKAAQTDWDLTPVSAIMTKRGELDTVKALDGAQSAVEKLGARDVDQLPVVGDDGETLIGMVSRADVARWLELHVKPNAGGTKGSGRPPRGDVIMRPA